MTEEMRFTVKRISSLPFLQRADGAEDFLGKGGGGEHGDADRQHTPKTEKEFYALGHSFFHSVSSNVDKRYRIS